MDESCVRKLHIRWRMKTIKILQIAAEFVKTREHQEYITKTNSQQIAAVHTIDSMQCISSRCWAAVHRGVPPQTFAGHSCEYSLHALPKSASTNIFQSDFKRKLPIIMHHILKQQQHMNWTVSVQQLLMCSLSNSSLFIVHTLSTVYIGTCEALRFDSI